jgi:hypothetical protein
MMMIGNYMLLNLFLAILLKFISENGEEDGQGEEATADDLAKSGENVDALKVHKTPTDANMELNDSAPLNSSNSNIEEEFE